ncbi:DUF4238 domain-containing protein [Marinobacterium iners]|uniref:DUF4238 domain-containing protein n=1 Tax=Marinobacterium iners DSM 11526 TaxID=1122198 RepID=A0A1H4HDP4_9GAMM|nr:DUF4238 domain-containing protein [Marinobacterium iners]SEB19188.1 Protein of unknown function [Marinobacterium iners DSM 11526]
MTTPKRHHFIPKGILKGFTFDSKNKKIKAFDKLENKFFPPNIINAACVSRLYDFQDIKKSLEYEFFGKIDGRGIDVIDKIRQSPGSYKMTPGEYESVVEYVASQICRTPTVLERSKRLNETLEGQFGKDYSIVKDNAQDDFLNSVLHDTEKYCEILKKKKFRVYEERGNGEFIIGDSPVISVHDGNVVEQFKSYMFPVNNYDSFALPISPKLLLVFYEENAFDNSFRIASLNNTFQFFRAYRFVYGRCEKNLGRERKSYFETAFDYVSSIRPEFVEREKIERGQPIYLDQERILFSDELVEKIKSI